EQGLTTHTTTCLHFDLNNNLWIGSDGKGAFTTAPIQLPEKKEDSSPPFVFIEEKPLLDPEGLNPEKIDESMLNKAMILNIQFQQSKSELLPNSIIELEKLVEILNKYPDWLVEIAGHTDNVGNAKLNVELSEQRAEVVRDYIVQRGISRDRIITVGYGGAKPIANNGSVKEREKNRRVEIVLKKRM
nr:OmpA family protein [Thermoflexibacter sp.]